jgi:hypothetical protein
MAGIAAASTNNSLGIAGVDWQAKVLTKDKHDYWNCTCYEALTHNHGDALLNQRIIEAVNFSSNVWTLNHSYDLVNDDNSSGRYSVTVREAFAYAYKNNRTSCVAMGNTNSSTTTYPAAFKTGLISVGASGGVDEILSFSTKGSYIDVAAP